MTSMDRPRDESFKRKRRLRRILLGATAVALILAVSVALGRLEPAAPAVKLQDLYTGTVERGDMLRQVRGPGTLVPEEIRWISAETEGRVEEIHLDPGSEARADTVLLTLSNPQLEREMRDAELALRAAEADFENSRIQAESDYLNQKAEAARVRSDLEIARLQAEADQKLSDEGLIPEINLRKSLLVERQLTLRDEIEGERLERAAEAIEARLASLRAEVEQHRGLYRLRREEVDSLRVRAGIAGVLQQIPVETGRRVNPGDILARVARPDTLKAELRIPETQAKDLVVGQRAEIDTRNGLVPGVVSRIHPAVENGTVTVDVSLQGELPRGARPDLSVDGTVEIERLENVLFVARPAHGRAHSTIPFFRIDPEAGTAERVPVELGSASVKTFEIVSGLAEGDRVILTDISQWDGHDRLRIK